MTDKPLDRSRTSAAAEPMADGKNIDVFLRRVASAPAPNIQPGRRGRLLFALDATASREPAWDSAMHIQAEMFSEAANVGGLEMQVAFYRGFGEFRASPWLTDSKDLLRRMVKVRCMAGRTQVGRVLRHAVSEARKGKVNAVVFVGDCFEEDIDDIAHSAGELGLLGVPVFIFHEGPDIRAEQAFRHVARLSNGAVCRFDAASADQLRQLLRAVAVFAAGGRRALSDFSKREGGVTLLLTNQMGDGR